MIFNRVQKLALFASLLSASLLSAVPARASVLVEPAILRRAQEVPEVPQPEVTAATTQDIVEVASSTSGFSTLVTALQAANVSSVLTGEGPFTVFAPTDNAFATLPPGTLEALLQPENRDLLVKLLYNHVAYGDVTSGPAAGWHVRYV
ncbi:MAG: fasciclin domain-containing protein [Cyanobacteria bacterium J06649_4]